MTSTVSCYPASSGVFVVAFVGGFVDGVFGPPLECSELVVPSFVPVVGEVHFGLVGCVFVAVLGVLGCCLWFFIVWGFFVLVCGVGCFVFWFWVGFWFCGCVWGSF